MKNWFASKTIWFNLLTATATATSWAMGVLTANPWLVFIMFAVNSLVNIALRFMTVTGLNPIKSKKG